MNSDLAQFLVQIETLHPQSIDLGLHRIREVGQRLLSLHFSCPVVLVGGTNGKGSTVAVLSALAKAAGFRVATYTSPHLYQFNERIQINEIQIDDETLLEVLKAIESARERVTLTFFEYTTLAALLYFNNQSPDLIVLEVGLGGRLDATNVIDPDISIVTSIGLDHTAYLGNTKEAIAFEKAGIARAQKPFICGEIPLQSVLQAHAQKAGALFYGLGQEFELRQGLKTNLVPSNIACAVKAAELLNIPVDSAVLESVIVPGRKEHRNVADHSVILDVAHNEDSLNELLRYLQSLDFSRFHFVMGMMGDKQLGSALPKLTDCCETLHLASPQTPRAMPAQALADLIGHRNTQIYPSVRAAFEAALAICRPTECVVVTGSFYTLSDLSHIML